MKVTNIISVFICGIILIWSGPAYSEDQADQSSSVPIEFEGYYKSLFTQSRSLATKENFYAFLQRVRLKAKADLSEQWQFVVNYDIESIINDFRNTPDFATIQNKNQGTLAAWDADHVLHDADNHYMRHSLYRAYINYYSPAFRAVLGKQKVDWGRTRFWSPLDLFNPVNPLDIEYTERVGVDAVNLEHSFEDFSSLALVYAAGPNKDLASVGMKYAKTLGTTDVFAVGGQFREDEVVGFGFDGQLANAGVRGEFTYTHPQNDGDYFRSVLGLEHSFENTLTLLGEYFYNGGADKTAFLQNLSDFRYTSRVLTRNKHLLGLNADYEWTPLLKMHQMMIYDMEDNSVFFNPQFNYNLKANLDIVLGSQFFWGRTGSEFGSYENVYYIQTQFYF